MKRFMIICCALTMLMLFGMGNANTAEAARTVVRRPVGAVQHQVRRSFNRGYRFGYRIARPRYYSPYYYRYAPYPYYVRGYRHGYVATPFFSVGF